MASSPSLVVFFSLMTLMGTLVSATAAASPSADIEASTNFIVTSCRATLYPRVCLHSLVKFASQIQSSPRELARAALLVSLAKARSTLARMSELEAIAMGRLSHEEVGAMKDCVENVADSIDMLKQSLGEMENLSQKQWGLEMNDLQTWVSAALTNADTCADGFAGEAMNGPVKETVRASILTMAQLTSNALDFINKMSQTKDGIVPSSPLV